MRVRTPPTAVACAATWLLCACAAPTPPAVPDALRVGGSESLMLVAAAKGVQVYECRAANESAAPDEWVFIAPEAELFDGRGNPIGKHGAGPYWQALDGSRTLGTAKARVDAPVGDAIPWLLLTARPDGPSGVFSKVTSVQRVNTIGGKAPSSVCSRSQYGTTARVPYSADYYFYTTR